MLTIIEELLNANDYLKVENDYLKKKLGLEIVN